MIGELVAPWSWNQCWIVREVEGAREHQLEFRTDAEGAYRFEGLLPGEYQLGWKRAFGTEWTYAMNRLVSVAPDAREVTADLKALGRATARGTLASSGELPERVFVFMQAVRPALDDQDEPPIAPTRPHSEAFAPF